MPVGMSVTMPATPCAGRRLPRASKLTAASMETTILLIFGVVYLGMILGGLPFLSLDRTGIALLGAIALIGAGAINLAEAWQAVHVPTLILLFAFMVVSAQLRMGGFYVWVTHQTGHLPLSPPKLLAALIA